MAKNSVVAVVEGLLRSSHYILPWKISWKVALLQIFWSRQFWKITLEVLGFSRHKLITALLWCRFLRNNCRGVEYYGGGIQRNLSLVLLLFWWHKCDGADNGSLRDWDIIPLLYGMLTCLSQLAFHGYSVLYQAELVDWRCSWIIHSVVHTVIVLGSCKIFRVSWVWDWHVGEVLTIDEAGSPCGY